MNYDEYKLFFLFGDIGAGKTTFVANFLKNYEVSSPTFSICNQYDTNIFHFDLYNINGDFNSLNNLNFFEICYDSTVFVEWSEKIESNCWSFIKSPYIKLQFKDFQITKGT